MLKLGATFSVGAANRILIAAQTGNAVAAASTMAHTPAPHLAREAIRHWSLGEARHERTASVALLVAVDVGTRHGVDERSEQLHLL